MDITVINAVISGCFSLAGALIGILASAKLTTYRIEQLEKKVDKHNQVIDRVYKLEQRGAVIDEKIKVANYRIADLEEREENESIYFAADEKQNARRNQSCTLGG